MNRKKLIEEYLNFFKSKGHKVIPNASLIPENDPTVLFTTAGMHPLVPFLLGEKHPQGKRLVNVQRCLRTVDIDEIGDTTHHTFFEMLGNWSLGDYFKKETIEWSYEFLTKKLKIDTKKLAVSVFEGDKDAERDEESAKIWESLGINKKRIVYLPKSENWWGPAGKTGPCGPDTEIFYWKLNNVKPPENFDPNNKNWVEIWNNVLMQYIKNEKGEYKIASQKNVDTGMGVERVIALLNNLEDNYLSDCFLPIIKQIEKISGKNYNSSEETKRTMRIIADHIKAATFLIADGVKPKNTEQGYILRRLIRRAIKHSKNIGIKKLSKEIAKKVIEIYDDYDVLRKNEQIILIELEKEEEQFNKVIEKGMQIFEKISKTKKEINGKEAFLLYQSFGFPIELIKEIAKEKSIKVDEIGFQKEYEKHQKISRTTSAGVFKSGLADDSEATKKLHTATHLLLRSLQIILKDEKIIQKGSNITPERLRLDFNFNRKLTEKEIKEIENLVNEKINEKIEVKKEEMSFEEAKKQGITGVFENKYGEKVSVYSINNFSREICAGPHVKNTSELGKFKIIKEEASSAGVRRIKAILE